MLEAFHLGLDVDDAIRRACGVEKAALEKGYREYLRTMLKDAPKAEKPMTFAELEAAHKKTPEDVDIAARLAAEYARRGKPAEARKLVDAVLEKEKGHPAASLVKARLLQRDKDATSARAVLEEAAKANPTDVRVLSALGRLQFELKELAAAAATFEAMRSRGGAEQDVLETLAQIYGAAKEARQARVGSGGAGRALAGSARRALAAGETAFGDRRAARIGRALGPRGALRGRDERGSARIAAGRPAGPER